jgi:hypothetical protein
MMSDIIRVNISVSREVHEYFQEKAYRSGVSMSAAMSLILFEKMEEEKRRQQQLQLPKDSNPIIRPL